MEQDVGHSRGGCNLWRALKGSGVMTSMVQMYIEHGGPVLRYRNLSGAPE